MYVNDYTTFSSSSTTNDYVVYASAANTLTWNPSPSPSPPPPPLTAVESLLKDIEEVCRLGRIK